MTTGLAALSFAAIGVADILRAPTIMASLAHLGYPLYFSTILGMWQLLGSVAIVAPGPARVQEWAYAGMFFTLSGAALSHAASGDPMGKILVPLALFCVVVASWALRPARGTPVASELAAERGA